MKSKEQDRALQVPAEANRDKHINFLAEENGDNYSGEESAGSRRSDDADSGNDESSNEKLQHEIRIDPGNEHHHRTDADDTIFDDDIDRSPRFVADAGGDPTGPEPGEGENDEPDTSGEDG